MQRRTDRDSSKFGIEQEEAQQRRETFWELYTYDSWQVRFPQLQRTEERNGRLTEFDLSHAPSCFPVYRCIGIRLCSIPQPKFVRDPWTHTGALAVPDFRPAAVVFAPARGLQIPVPRGGPEWRA